MLEPAVITPVPLSADEEELELRLGTVLERGTLERRVTRRL